MADGCNHFSFSGAAGSFKMSPSLPGPPGPPGKSAYEAAVEGGYTGTEAEFNTALGEVDTALQPSDVDAELSGSSTNPVQNKVVKSALDNKAPVIIDTASGAVASFPDGADGLPLHKLTVQIEPVQAGSGDPSPTNIRPISGWNGMTGGITAKNFVDKTEYIYPSDAFGVTLTYRQDGTITANGTGTNETPKIKVLTNKFTLPAGSYVFSGAGGINDDSYLRIRKYVDGVFNSNLISGNGTFTLQQAATVDIVFYLRANTTLNNVTYYPMIRLASDSDPTFEPYKGQTYQISWQTEAGTVYGGTLDATNGVLSVTNRTRFVSVDGNKILRAGTTAGGYNFIELKSKYFEDIQEIVMSNAYPVVTLVSPLGIWLSTDKTRIFVYDNRFVDLQTAKDIADTTNIQVLYALTTPVTYQLTPQEVATLLGVNNIWADCGQVSVEYRADTKLYIDSKIAAAVAALS